VKGFSLFFILLSGLLLSSCAGGFGMRPSSDQSQESVVSSSTGADTILSCLAEHQAMSRKDFKAAYKTASVQAAGGAEEGVLRLICLSLHEYASCKQFKYGTDTLVKYIKDHPDDAARLQGIHVLMQRIDKEKIVKWAQSNKNLDEKEGLEAENKELSERNEALEKGAAQDQERIRELQKQIEQLKDIENIIKNREH